MQQHVSEFLADLVHVVPTDRRRQLIRLLDRVLAQAIEGLFTIPRTFLPEVVHNVQQPLKRLQLLLSPRAHNYAWLNYRGDPVWHRSIGGTCRLR